MGTEYDDWMTNAFGTTFDRQMDVPPAPVTMDAPAERETNPDEPPPIMNMPADTITGQRPSAPPPPQLSDVQDGYRQGYNVGLDGDMPMCPANATPAYEAAYERGYADGKAQAKGTAPGSPAVRNLSDEEVEQQKELEEERKRAEEINDFRKELGEEPIQHPHFGVHHSPNEVNPSTGRTYGEEESETEVPEVEPPAAD